MNKRPKILVVGSLMMNHGIETSVIPEEGQTVMGEDIQKSPGGKGANQAVQMARLGADVTLIGKRSGWKRTDQGMQRSRCTHRTDLI